MPNEIVEEHKKLKAEKLKKLQEEKKVKIKVLRPIAPDSLGGKIYEPSKDLKKPTIISVAESEAKMFCDEAFKGYTEDPGEHSRPRPLPKIVRAERVTTSNRQ